ncbi:mitochondrial peripheral inner membrane protein [Neurospora sp. IMI 360204]|nr:mitochondrial peripheral inner membrane protein [Neurospora sp. IMI 360204]
MPPTGQAKDIRLVHSNTTSLQIRIISRPYSSKNKLSPGEGMGYHPTPQNQKQEQPKQNQKPDGSSSSNSNSNKTFFKPSLTNTTLLIAAFLSGYLFHSIILRPNDLSLRDVPVLLGLTSPPTLNTTSFVPYTIVEREQVSSTAFVLVVEPFNPLHNIMSEEEIKRNVNLRNDLQEAWHHGLWCVEIKQPQLQVARDYTPLPPPVGQEKEDMVRGRLRFLIRKMEGGEVSSYLSKLKVGDKVELRGPHLGFDVAKRLGGLESTSGEEQGRVVFLAGGTGIAPALQVARRLYGPVYEKGTGKEEEWKEVEDMPTTPPKMTIVWANRFREDCPDCEDLEELRKRGYLIPLPSLNQAKNAAGGGIMPYLQDIKAHHPEQFTYACTVDAEKKFIDAKTILDAVVSTTPKSSSSALTKSTASPSCPLHSSSALISVSDRQDHEAKCKCASSHANGKNLLMVSGPDGFIARFAGPKAWSEGLERQGHVAGVAGELMRKEKVRKEEWMVLKL